MSKCLFLFLFLSKTYNNIAIWNEGVDNEPQNEIKYNKLTQIKYVCMTNAAHKMREGTHSKRGNDKNKWESGKIKDWQHRDEKKGINKQESLEILTWI